MVEAELRTRWEDLTNFVEESKRNKWWDRIVAAYKPRPFHNLEHLAEMLRHFDKHKDRLRDRYATGFAIFFKNLVYDAYRSDNAEKSAAAVREFCSETTFDSEGYVVNMIEASGSNCTDANLNAGEYGSDDVHYLIDFDMAFLAAKNYKQQEKAIRQECANLNDEEYRTQRLKILKFFLQVPNIYGTKDFRDAYEAIARENITAEIARLESS